MTKELMDLIDAFAKANRAEANVLENGGPSELEDAINETHEARAAVVAALREALEERKPLDDEQLVSIMERLGITVFGPAAEAVQILARAVEAAHGIGETP